MKSIKYFLALPFLLWQMTSLAQTNEFYFNGSSDVIFRDPAKGSGGRVLVHGDGNTLLLNYGGDFSGGTKVGPSIFFGNNGAMQMPDGVLFKGSNFETNDYSTMTFSSRAWHTVQGNNGKAFSFLTHNNLGNGGFEMLAIYYGEGGKIVMGHSGGNVGIGTSNPTEKLSVKGKIRAQEIKVENANWPDYVFLRSYKLPTLQETEKHIKEKGHLSGIPSASEVKANGVDLGDMNAKLLQKIEEMTLHLIEKDKQLVSQKEELLEQKKQLSAQQTQINEILQKLK